MNPRDRCLLEMMEGHETTEQSQEYVANLEGQDQGGHRQDHGQPRSRKRRRKRSTQGPSQTGRRKGERCYRGALNRRPSKRPATYTMCRNVSRRRHRAVFKTTSNDFSTSRDNSSPPLSATFTEWKMSSRALVMRRSGRGHRRCSSCLLYTSPSPRDRQ